MLQHIEKMREKPVHIRKRISFFVSLGITGLIFVFWIASFRIGSSDSNTQVVADIKSPASSLLANASGAFEYIKEMLVGSNKTSYDSSSVIKVTPADK